MRSDCLHRPLHPVVIVERDLQVDVRQVQHRLHGAVGDGQHRQAGGERRVAQLPYSWVGLDAAGEQHGRDVGAADRRHAGGQQQIVTVTGHDRHRPGAQILATVGQGTGAQRDMGDATVQLTCVEDLRADHVHDVPHSRRDQIALPGDAAQQLEGLRPAPGAFGLQLGCVALVEDILGAAEIEADMTGGVHRRVQQVDDAADHSLVADAAVGLGHHFHQFGHLARVVAARSGDDDDPGIQALRDLGIEMGTVGPFLGIHQAFDHHHTGFPCRALVAGDHLF